MPKIDKKELWKKAENRGMEPGTEPPWTTPEAKEIQEKIVAEVEKFKNTPQVITSLTRTDNGWVIATKKEDRRPIKGIYRKRKPTKSVVIPDGVITTNDE